ncbi:MAG TPA: hypothetical protein ACFYD1_09260, partial [Candidatus Hypogeohydataceae bacterium YC38]
MKNSHAKRGFILSTLLVLLLSIASFNAPATPKKEVSKEGEGQYAQERRRMVEEQISARGVKDPRVLQA